MSPPDPPRRPPGRPRSTPHRRGVAIALGVLAVGLAWRTVVGLLVVPAWEARAGVGGFPDAYPQLAATWIETGMLGYGELGATPTTVRGPGWPLWLASGMVLGLDGRLAIPLWAAVPGVLGAGAIAYVLARRYGAAAGVLGGLVAAIHPLPAIASARAMGDEFYGVLGFTGLALFWAAVPAPAGVRRGSRILAGGAALALQMLTRATGLLALVALGLSVLRPTRRHGRLIASLAVVALLPPLAWSVRSSRLEGRPVFVHSLLGYNFWFGDAYHELGAGRVAGETRSLAMHGMAERCAMPELASPRFWYARLTPRETAELERCLVGAAVRRVVDDPLGYLGRFGTGVARFWLAADDPRRSTQYAWLVVPLLAAALAGAVRTFRESDGADPLGTSLVWLVVLHNLAYAGTWPMARLSVQVYPALAYLAGVGLGWLGPQPRVVARSGEAVR